MSEEATTKPPRLNLQDCRNQDFVSRLLAATPPYLYAAPTGPHSFFFSEMLRSLVQSKTNNERNSIASSNSANGTVNNSPNLNSPIQQHMNQNSTGLASGAPQSISVVSQSGNGVCNSNNNTIRRPRKRSWNHQKPSSFETVKKLSIANMIDEQQNKEKPLELTINKSPPISQSSLASAFSSPKQLSSANDTFNENSTNHNIQVTAAPSSSITSSSSPMSLARQSSELSLPPPPPMWYPPLYPPYGIDPLHFFIDLRVSGHIYDRKKDNLSPILRTPPSLLLNEANNNGNNNNNNNTPTYLDPDSLMKCRQNSAFSVPVPKDSHSAVNLSSSSTSAAAHLNDDYDSKDAIKTSSSHSTNYVMQNLPRIYTNLSPHTSATSSNSRNSPDSHCISSTDDKENLKEKIKKFEINYKLENDLSSSGGSGADESKNGVANNVSRSNQHHHHHQHNHHHHHQQRHHDHDGHLSANHDRDRNDNNQDDDDEPITIEEID